MNPKNNVEKNSQTTYKLNLLDIEKESIEIPPAVFETELTLPSIDFQKIIKDIMNQKMAIPVSYAFY